MVEGARLGNHIDKNKLVPGICPRTRDLLPQTTFAHAHTRRFERDMHAPSASSLKRFQRGVVEISICGRRGGAAASREVRPSSVAAEVPRACNIFAEHCHCTTRQPSNEAQTTSEECHPASAKPPGENETQDRTSTPLTSARGGGQQRHLTRRQTPQQHDVSAAGPIPGSNWRHTQ